MLPPFILFYRPVIPCARTTQGLRTVARGVQFGKANVLILCSTPPHSSSFHPTPAKVCRQFTPEFKQEAVELLRRSGKTATQVARELGIGQTTLSRWNLQAAKMPLGSKGFLAAEELKAVRRELDQVRQERDILKKAVAFFAKESS